MAIQQHIDLIKQGSEAWNTWRKQHPDIQPDFSGADLSKLNLSETNLFRANFRGATLIRTNFSRAILIDANLDEADLRGANLWGALLKLARFCNADLREACLRDTELEAANFTHANLSGSYMNGAILIRTILENATLTDCYIHGIAVWNVELKGAIQSNLVITDFTEPRVTVDNLKIAQFIYLLLNNQEIRDVIDTITSKVVLILGRFTPERKAVLDALRNELRKQNYSPILFDFEKPSSRDFTETVRTIAHLSRFIIADLTDPSSIPQELQTIVPDLEVPVQPLLLEAKREYSMFVDFRKYHWVLPVYLYKDRESLIASLQDEIIEPAEKKARELAIEKANRLERP